MYLLLCTADAAVVDEPRTSTPIVMSEIGESVCLPTALPQSVHVLGHT